MNTKSYSRSCEYLYTSARVENILSADISEKPPALQLLMLIPEAIDVSSSLSPPLSPSLPPADEGDRLSLPNCYLICKLFCTRHHPPTPVQWASHNPQFGFKQVHVYCYSLCVLDIIITRIKLWVMFPGLTRTAVSAVPDPRLAQTSHEQFHSGGGVA